MEMSDYDILAHIRRHLFHFNKDAGIIHVPGDHRDRNDKYVTWITTTNTAIESIVVPGPRKRER